MPARTKPAQTQPGQTRPNETRRNETQPSRKDSTMTSFDSPGPVHASIDVLIGDVRITAGERTDTVVDVRPSNPDKDLDVRAAEQTQVTYDAGRLLVKGPRQRGLGLFGKVGSVQVTIGLPAGSRLHGATGVGAFRVVGRVGDCRLKTGVGAVDIDHAAEVELNTGAGEINVHRVDRGAEVTTGTGQLRIGSVAGNAVLKNANGDSWIDEVAGELRISAANGDVNVGVAGADVTAHTANGSVRVDRLSSGSASLKTAMGSVEFGIAAGTAARLDVSTQFGRVDNRLTAAAGPQATDRTVEVRARTSFGDIVIRRS
jgi:hypothetical protein